jgi:hypothetical protein
MCEADITRIIEFLPGQLHLATSRIFQTTFDAISVFAAGIIISTHKHVLDDTAGNGAGAAR